MEDHRSRDLYADLQVDPKAQPEVIEAAYRRLARIYHPDVSKSADAGEVMRRLNLAYEVLSNAAKRAEYDWARGIEAQRKYASKPKRSPSERMCPRCGVPNNPGRSYCLRCSSPIRETQPGSATSASDSGSYARTVPFGVVAVAVLLVVG